MAEDLRGLLDKIRRQGIEKAEAESAELVTQAEAKAAEIISKARQEASDLVTNAQKEAELLIKRGESALAQAGRDAVAALKVSLRERLDNILLNQINEAMTPEFMAQIVGEMAASFAKNPDGENSLTVLVNPAKAAELEKALIGSLKADFVRNAQIFGDNNIGSGLKVAINGSDLFYDFSDSAVMEIIGAYIGPHLAAVLNSNK